MKYINGYGLVTGLRLYFYTKNVPPNGIQLPFLKHRVHLRKAMSDRLMFEQLFLKKEYDIEIPFEPKTIIDLGANAGFASIFFANRFPEAKIVCLEPDEENYQLTKKNTAAYQNITALKGAIWHKTERLKVVDHGHGEAAYMVEPGGEDAAAVQAYTVKDIMTLMNITEIDVLKIDIEGAEKEIFETGYETWLPFTKVLIAETHDRYKKGTSKAVFSSICKYDFSLELSGENLVLYNNNLLPGFTPAI